MANTCVAYFLWLVGGWLGLHHFYLKRDKQAFVWWCLPGGYFGLGWIRDIWRIPEYVKEANEEKIWKMQQQEKQRTSELPPWKMARSEKIYKLFFPEHLRLWQFLTNVLK